MQHNIHLIQLVQKNVGNNNLLDEPCQVLKGNSEFMNNWKVGNILLLSDNVNRQLNLQFTKSVTFSKWGLSGKHLDTTYYSSGH